MREGDQIYGSPHPLCLPFSVAFDHVEGRILHFPKVGLIYSEGVAGSHLPQFSLMCHFHFVPQIKFHSSGAGILGNDRISKQAFLTPSSRLQLNHEMTKKGLLHTSGCPSHYLMHTLHRRPCHATDKMSESALSGSTWAVYKS